MLFEYHYAIHKELTEHQIRDVKKIIDYITDSLPFTKVDLDWFYESLVNPCNYVAMELTNERDAFYFDALFLHLQDLHLSFEMLISTNHYADWYAAEYTLCEILFEIGEPWDEDVSILDSLRDIPYLRLCKEKTEHLEATKEKTRNMINEIKRLERLQTI